MWARKPALVFPQVSIYMQCLKTKLNVAFLDEKVEAMTWSLGAVKDEMVVVGGTDVKSR